MARRIAVSGGFDPLHVGHVQLFKAARALGDELVVILNNDNWLMAKKGFVVMPEHERVALISEFPYVDAVVLTDHGPSPSDMSVSESLKQIQPQVFAFGGGRTREDVPEAEAKVCAEQGIELAFNIGGEKTQSSSSMMKNAHLKRITTGRPWGHFRFHEVACDAVLKTIHIEPGKRLSLQRHKFRDETWFLIDGDASALLGDSVDSLRRVELEPHSAVVVPRHTIHRLESKNGCVIVEMSAGDFDEDDIERLDDDFGRASPGA